MRLGSAGSGRPAPEKAAGRGNGKVGHRWGWTRGKLGFHGGKVALKRPRVRARNGDEIAPPSGEAAMAEDWLGK